MACSTLGADRTPPRGAAYLREKEAAEAEKLRKKQEKEQAAAAKAAEKERQRLEKEREKERERLEKELRKQQSKQKSVRSVLSGLWARRSSQGPIAGGGQSGCGLNVSDRSTDPHAGGPSAVRGGRCGRVAPEFRLAPGVSLPGLRAQVPRWRSRATSRWR